jgi:hypothetical protein
VSLRSLLLIAVSTSYFAAFTKAVSAIRVIVNFVRSAVNLKTNLLWKTLDVMSKDV